MKTTPIHLHAIYISVTTSPIHTKFGSNVPTGFPMTPDKFGANRPKDGAVIDAEIYR